jgi:hypothetical protein
VRRHRLRDQGGQASPEWLGLVFVVSLVYAALVAAGVRVPGTELASAIAGKLACAAGLGEGCGGEPTALVLEYGPELAQTVSRHVPTLQYEQGMLSLPVDYRECRELACAQGAYAGVVEETRTGLPVTLFSHVIDCRQPATPMPSEARCDGDRAGNLYVQYWAYYPDSRTVPFGKAGYHPDDWESFQVRIGPDATAERASSHHGYNGHGGDPLNDTGFLPGRSAWSEPTGRYWISSGSHAGRVGAKDSFARLTFPWQVDVVPIESLRDVWSDYVGSPDHLPAWLKDVYLDPEATGTSG